MSLLGVASGVASRRASAPPPAALDAPCFEGSSPEDVVAALAPFFHAVHGPFWVAPGENGRVLVGSDPSGMEERSPVRIPAGAGPGDSTFGDLSSRAGGEFVRADASWLTSDEVAEFAMGEYSGDPDVDAWAQILSEFGLT